MENETKKANPILTAPAHGTRTADWQSAVSPVGNRHPVLCYFKAQRECATRHPLHSE